MLSSLLLLLLQVLRYTFSAHWPIQMKDNWLWEMYLTEIICNFLSLIWMKHWSNRDYCWSHHVLIESRHTKGHLLTSHLSHRWSHHSLLLLLLCLLCSLTLLLLLFVFSLSCLILLSLLLTLSLGHRRRHSHHLLILLHLLLVEMRRSLLILKLIVRRSHLVHKWLHLLLQKHWITIHLLDKLWTTHLHKLKQETFQLTLLHLLQVLHMRYHRRHLGHVKASSHSCSPLRLSILSSGNILLLRLSLLVIGLLVWVMVVLLLVLWLLLVITLTGALLVSLIIIGKTWLHLVDWLLLSGWHFQWLCIIKRNISWLINYSSLNYKTRFIDLISINL